MKNKVDCYKILIGTKCDLESNRQVQQNEAQKWADNNNIHMYLEVSAKNRINVDKLVYEIASQFGEPDEDIVKNIIGI